MFLLRIVKWVFRLLKGRAIPGLSGQSLSSVVTGLLGSDGAQLPGLLKKLTTGGLGDLVQSWVGKGKNLPLSADQVKSALDSKTLSGIAGQLGRLRRRRRLQGRRCPAAAHQQADARRAGAGPADTRQETCGPAEVASAPPSGATHGCHQRSRDLQLGRAGGTHGGAACR